MTFGLLYRTVSQTASQIKVAGLWLKTKKFVFVSGQYEQWSRVGVLNHEPGFESIGWLSINFRLWNLMKASQISSRQQEPVYSDHVSSFPSMIIIQV